MYKFWALPWKKRAAIDLCLHFTNQTDVKCLELGVKFLFHLYHSKSYYTDNFNKFYKGSVTRRH